MPRPPTKAETKLRDRYRIWRKKIPTGDIISANQFDRELLEVLFRHVDWIGELRLNQWVNHLRGKVMITCFEKESTRTRGSFEAAMYYLGGMVVSTANANFSSMSKGESLWDNYRTMGGQGDILVMRAKDEGTARIAADASPKPVINGGDGSGEHPTQALLDMYALWRRLGSIDGRTVTMLGDLKDGRTVHSLAKLLALYDVNMRFVSPEFLMIPDKLRNFLHSIGARFEESHELLPAIPGTDMLYVTRPQLERKEDEAERELVKANPYFVPPNVREYSDRRMLIHHPLPRTKELPRELDDHPDSIYFEVGDDGIPLRMGIVDLILRPIEL